VAVLKLLKDQPGRLFVGGGFLRACVANESASDVDLFASSYADAKVYAELLVAKLGHGNGVPLGKVVETDNAFTIKGYQLPVQIIHRWTYTSPEQLMSSFDFTIAMAGFWWQAERKEPEEIAVDCASAGWRSICDDRFYPDLAARRLRYTSPQRNEDAGGSLLRVLKFYQRGYRIPLDSLGAVVARLAVDVKTWQVLQGRDPDREMQVARVLTGLLREVDPNIDPSHIAHLPSVVDELDDADAASVIEEAQ
jgi:hypothetical protein